MLCGQQVSSYARIHTQAPFLANKLEELQMKFQKNIFKIFCLFHFAADFAYTRVMLGVIAIHSHWQCNISWNWVYRAWSLVLQKYYSI